MEDLFMILLLASLVLLVIGFFKPNTSLFWNKKNPTRKQSTLIYGGLVILFFVLFGVSSKDIKESGSSAKAQQENVVNNNKEVEKSSELSQAQKDSIAQVQKVAELDEIKKNTVSARNLTVTYEANEVAADKNFKGKTFYVSGTVTDIKKDFTDDIYVVLEGDEMFRQVQCFLEDEESASKLQKGIKITLKGTCDGLIITNVIMKDCALVQ